VIHETAIIDPSAEIADNVVIGPYSVIGKNVSIGAGTVVGPHVVINGPTTIGKDNRFFQFGSIGEDPQDKKYANEPTTLEIGDGNVFRESMTISRGTIQGGGRTLIGNNNLFMAYVHIAHDCIIKNNVTFSNNASLAGHVVVDDYANLGGFVGVHQFCNIGRNSFCAGASVIVKDVLPFVIVSGHPARVFGLNTVGLKRKGFSADIMLSIKNAYKAIYRKNLTVESALLELKSEALDCEPVRVMAEFISQSSRGIVR